MLSVHVKVENLLLGHLTCLIDEGRGGRGGRGSFLLTI